MIDDFMKISDKFVIFMTNGEWLSIKNSNRLDQN